LYLECLAWLLVTVYFQLPKGIVNNNACQLNSDKCALSGFGKEEEEESRTQDLSSYVT